MVLDVTSLLCPFTVASNIFMLKKDTSKQHYNNVRLNIPDNASLAVYLAIYHAALVENWLVMGVKIDSSPVEMQLSKMEVAIEKIASFVIVGNLAVNQLMECEAAAVVMTKVLYAEEPKWTMVMPKNMHQVVSRAMETLVDTPKQEEHKFNLHLTSFEAKEGKTKNELVQWLNIELLQGQMKLSTKVVAAMWQPLAIAQVCTLARCCSSL